MKLKTFIIVIVSFLFVGLAIAQTNIVGTNAPVAGGVELPALAKVPVWLQMLIVPITLALVEGIRRAFPKIPSTYYPFIVPFVGAAINIASDAVGLWGAQGLANSAIAGAALGALSTWLHQLGKQSGVIAPTEEK